ncbi:hypothetical protein KSB_02570 [Ktedonobacter robiniae]|uniref:histidine kinase n=1 Tax=Ktedonobacter robiniae TaxID=2778365 RepID=A0ABQ3UGG1_9CHLR|nr:hypothetical protein KSB_02570 [Ktedonobacter robiniae]
MSHTKQKKRVTPASSETLLTLLETLPGALFLLDDDATIVYANANAQTMTRKDVCGKPLWRGAPQLVSTSLYQAVQKAKQTREPTEVEYISPVTNSRLHVSLSPTNEGLAIFFQEYLEPQSPQNAFSQNEHMYRDLLESFSDGVTILTPEGLVLDVNQRPLADAHLQREEMIGKPFADSPAWSHDPAAQQQLRAAIARASRGETVRFEARIHPRSDLSLDILMTITSHRDANQQVEYLICAGRDITERKYIEDELRTLVDAIPHFVWIARPDGHIIYNNQPLIDYQAMSREQVEGDGWIAAVHPDDRQRVWDVWQTAIQRGVPYEVEHRMQDGINGAYRWFLVRGVPQRNAGGTILHWIGTCTDIDKQKQAEQRIKANEQNFRVLAETVPQLVWTTRPDGLSDYFNQRFRDYTHATFEQLYGYGWSQFLHPDDSERTLAARAHAFRTGTPYEVAYRFKEGQTGVYRWFLARAMPVRNDTGQIVKWFGTITDIDDQKRTEQRLKDSEENLRVLAETMPQFVWTTRPDGRLDYCNQRYCEYTHATFEQIQGYGWRQFLHPEDIERSLALRHHTLETGEPFEREHRLRNGQTGSIAGS